MQKQYDVVCIGAAIVDLPLGPVGKEVFDQASYPIDDISMTIGGDAINEATVITRLGHQVRLISSVGDDVPGHYVLEHCKMNGIDTEHIKIDPDKKTSINVGLVTADGERTFITNRQGSLWKFCYEDIDITAVGGAKILSFASIFNHPLLDGAAMEKIFQKAKAEGMIICADMVNPRLGETLLDIKQALPYIDYFFPNYEEASLMTGETDAWKIADRFIEYGIKHVIVKTGKKGCVIRSATERAEIPGYPDSQCIDTIGAGDNFASGFISALLEGRNFKECAGFANAVASISVEYAGATKGVRSRKQAEERFELYKSKTNQG